MQRHWPPLLPQALRVGVDVADAHPQHTTPAHAALLCAQPHWVALASDARVDVCVGLSADGTWPRRWLQQAHHVVLLSPINPPEHYAQLQWLAAPMPLANLEMAVHHALEAQRITLAPNAELQLSPSQLHGPNGTVELSWREATLLLVLARMPEGVARHVVLRDWFDAASAEAESHALETQLYRLRQKLSAAGLEGWQVVLHEGQCQLRMAANTAA